MLATANAARIPLVDGVVHACITSPPFWSLRDYGLEPMHWPAVTYSPMPGLPPVTVPEMDACLGLEPTPEAYVGHIVAVFREVWRVLRGDGVAWVNLGDSYFSGAQRATSCGTSDKAPEDYQEHGCLCGNLCDACRVVYQSRKSHNDSLLVAMLTASLSVPTLDYMESEHAHLPTLDSAYRVDHSVSANQGQEHSLDLAGEQLHASLVSMIGESSPQLLDVCLQRANYGECLLCGRSLVDCAQGFAHKLSDSLVQSLHSQGNALHVGQQVRHSQCKDTACEYYSGVLSSGPSYIQPHCTTEKQAAQASQSLKPKDLVGIPWRVAFALQADGWYLRSDILWIKPNCMPESVRDRPTKAHEYIFLLAKSKRYYYDADAIRETATTTEHHRKYHSKASNSEYSNKHGAATLAVGGGGQTGLLSGNVPAGRNRRTAWTIPTSPYGGAHYAAYPRELVRVMLKASVSERGVCPKCNAPWRRVVERTRESSWQRRKQDGHIAGSATLSLAQQKQSSMSNDADRAAGGFGVPSEHITTAWRPTCTCAGKSFRGPVRCGKCGGTGREQLHVKGTGDWTQGSAVDRQYQSDTRQTNICKADTGAPCPHCTNGTTEGDVWPADVDTWPIAPAIVLDPFVGSGTTAVVCQELRQLGTPVICVGLDLNHHYLADLARERLGLLALEEWEGGKDGGNGRGLEGLPLFRELRPCQVRIP